MFLTLVLLSGCWTHRIAAGPSFPVIEDVKPVVAVEGEVSLNLTVLNFGVRGRAKFSSGLQQLALAPQVGLRWMKLLPNERFGFVRIVGGIHLAQFDHQRGVVGMSLGSPFLEPGASVSLFEVGKRSLLLLSLSVPLEYDIRLHRDLRSGPAVGVLMGVEVMTLLKELDELGR